MGISWGSEFTNIKRKPVQEEDYNKQEELEFEFRRDFYDLTAQLQEIKSEIALIKQHLRLR